MKKVVRFNYSFERFSAFNREQTSFYYEMRLNTVTHAATIALHTLHAEKNILDPENIGFSVNVSICRKLEGGNPLIYWSPQLAL